MQQRTKNIISSLSLASSWMALGVAVLFYFLGITFLVILIFIGLPFLIWKTYAVFTHRKRKKQGELELIGKLFAKKLKTKEYAKP